MDVKCTDNSEIITEPTNQNGHKIQDELTNNNVVLQSKQHQQSHPPLRTEQRSDILHIQTPTTTRPFPRVRNPFESALTERLHLPLIARYYIQFSIAIDLFIFDIL